MVGSVTDKVGSVTGDIADKANSVAGSVTDKVGSVTGDVADTASSMIDSVTDKGSSVANDVTDTAMSTAESVTDKVESVTNDEMDTTSSVTENIAESVAISEPANNFTLMGGDDGKIARILAEHGINDRESLLTTPREKLDRIFYDTGIDCDSFLAKVKNST